MRCEAESARMGDTLAVDDKDIRLVFEFFDGGNAGGSLAERKQAGDIGEADFLDGTCCFDGFEAGGRQRLPKTPLSVRDFQNNEGSDNSFAIFAKGTVQAGN